MHFVFSTQVPTVSSYADILLDITLEHRRRIWTLGAQEHRGLELLTPNANRIPIMKEMLDEYPLARPTCNPATSPAHHAEGTEGMAQPAAMGLVGNAIAPRGSNPRHPT